MTTLNDVITEAWRKSGVLGLGQSMTGDDTVSAVQDFNDMVAQWQTQRWMTWGLQELSINSAGTTTGYTVGPGGQLDPGFTPTRLEYAFQRQIVTSGLNVDTPFEIIPSREEYARLSLKTLQSFGLYAFLDTSTFPLAKLLLYPWPQATLYSIFIGVKAQLPVFTVQQLGSTLSIPAHYISALKFNLAKRYRQAYGKGLRPDQELNGLARSSLDIVKQSNLQVPELVMPKVLVRQTSGYNILSDQFGS
jgi:hypothetical protein